MSASTPVPAESIEGQAAGWFARERSGLMTPRELARFLR